MKWNDFEREDLRLIPFMEADGWKPDFHQSDFLNLRITPDKPPLNPVAFWKNDACVYPNLKINEWRLIYFSEGNRTIPIVLALYGNGEIFDFTKKIEKIENGNILQYQGS